MKIKKWKERNPKENVIILFTILSILLIVGVFFYQSFAIFKANTNQNLIEGNVENMGDLEFAFYIDGDLSPTAPKKDGEYSFDSSSSKCIDIKTGNQISSIVWNDTRWSAEVKNITNTKTKCFLNFKQIYKEGILNEAIPDLMNGRLVPVKISDKEKPKDVTYTNSTGTYGGKVTKADITSEWYSYAEKKWANAVILKDKSISYQNNEEIPESNIESYFVWIPRFEYQIWNGETQTYLAIKDNIEKIEDITQQQELNQAQPIHIQFTSKKEPIKSDTTLGKYFTHPAFTTFDSNGIWVGKFETGYNQNSKEEQQITDTNTWSTIAAQVNEEQPNKVIIKPNVYSWRNVQVAKAFYTAYNYKRELESHLIKNMEWGAITYLTYSIYGRCTENTCEKVRINNNGSYVTGYGAKNNPTCGYTAENIECNKYDEEVKLNVDGSNSWNYDNPLSQKASTTGNYTGIYDMSGGSWEFTMGMITENDNLYPSIGTPTSNSGFKGYYSDSNGLNKGNHEKKIDGYELPSNIYYDLYDYGLNGMNFERGHFGDATKELGPFYSVSYKSYIGKRDVEAWFNGVAYFPSATLPWFARSTNYFHGTEADLGSFAWTSGDAMDGYSYRIVLTP